jgi:hypothetical protein
VIVDLPVTPTAWKSGLQLLAVIAHKMFVCHARTVLFWAVLAAQGILLVLAWHEHGLDRQILGSARFLIVLGGLVLVSVAEEFGHAAACIAGRHSDAIRGFRVANWCVGSKCRILVESFGVHFQGRISPKDFLRIAAAGPLFAFMVGTLLFSVMWLLGINRPDRSPLSFWVSLCLLLGPLVSLAPFSASFPSDGRRIIEIRDRCHLETTEVLKEVALGFAAALRYSLGTLPKNGVEG